MDIKHLLDEPSFLFLIGPEKKQFYLSPGVLAETSPKLYKMTQPGWKEYQDGCVVIADVEPEIFALFGEYAYYQTYTISAEKVDQKMSNLDKPYYGLEEFHCYRCGGAYQAKDCEQVHSPFCSRLCEKTDNCGWNRSAEGYCVNFGDQFDDGQPEHESLQLCSECTVRIEASSEHVSIIHKPAGEQFCGLRLKVGLMSYHELNQRLKIMTPNDAPTLDLVTHARLYAFADYNMIAGLQELCLFKLHRDLLAFPLSKKTVGKVVELMKFVYSNTASMQNGGDGENAGIDMRHLVTMYVVGLAKNLGEMEEFRIMLADGGDCVNDFIQGMSKRLI